MVLNTNVLPSVSFQSFGFANLHSFIQGVELISQISWLSSWMEETHCRSFTFLDFPHVGL
uniref:Uncharacterized protein n=1 Tax=Anguilla anguilla TaxID=7936 RepID=A0A0E9VDR4_ANGAN